MSKRSGTDKRQRTHLVGVRLSRDEWALLEAACARSGLSHASQLRRAFMVAYQDVPMTIDSRSRTFTAQLERQ